MTYNQQQGAEEVNKYLNQLDYEDKKRNAKFSTTKKRFNRDRISELEREINYLERLQTLDEKQLETLKNYKKEQRNLYEEQKKLSGFRGFSQDVKTANDSLVKFYKTFREFVEPWAKADAAAAKFTKTIGGTKKALDDLRSRTIDNVATGIAVKFNISMEELIKAQTDYINGVGRNLSVDDRSQETIAALAKFGSDTGINTLELAAQFENFGVSVNETGNHVGKMFAEASKSGINANKYAENVSKNIRIAQNFTFKDGLRGLENMAKKATAMKMDMQQVANFADKVSTVEGAIETSARIQVLGGPFASMADPMGMLNESINDMESFQDRQIKLLSQFGRFNKATGEVSISAFDKRRLRAYAEATGQDYSSIMESVQTGAKRTEIDRQMGMSKTKFSDDMKEYIRNTAVFEDGKAGVKINGKFVNLDEINETEHKKYLEDMTRTESQDIKEIVSILRSLKDKEEGIGKAFESVQAWIAAPFGNLLKWVHGIFDFTVAALGILGTIAVAKNAIAIGSGAMDLSDTFGELFEGRTSGSGNKQNKLNKRKKGPKLKSRGGLLKRSIAKIFKGNTSGAANAISNSTKGLSKIGKLGKVGGGLAGAGIGILGAVGNHYTDKAIAEGKMQVGSNSHHAAKMGSRALEWGGIGAGLGSFAGGPMGAAIGGAIGATAGAIGGWYEASKAKSQKALETQLTQKGIKISGDYSKWKMDDIEEALNSGKMSEDLRKTLYANGDIAIVQEIEKKKAEVEAKKVTEDKNKIKHNFKIDTANITIGKSNFKDFGINNSLLNPLNYNNSISINGVKEKGDSEKVKPRRTTTNQEDTTTNIPTTFNININGSLKLTGENGKAIDIINELKNNDILLRQLTNIIIDRGFNIKKHGTDVQTKINL